jgi:SAM-dependent methyltransferase
LNDCSTSVKPENAFSGLTEAYRRHRPCYPREIVDQVLARLSLGRGDLVADVGAGTGIFTRSLIEVGLTVIACELSRDMIDPLREICPRVFQARAEELPLAAGSMRGIFAAQAFHWFDPIRALREWHRVLAPGCGLALVWNDRAPERSDFVRDYEVLIVRHNPSHRGDYRHMAVREILEGTGLFEGIEGLEMERIWRIGHEEMIGFSHSVSYIATALGPERLPRFDDDLRALMRGHFADGPVEIPLRCRAWIAKRIQR